MNEKGIIDKGAANRFWEKNIRRTQLKMYLHIELQKCSINIFITTVKALLVQEAEAHLQCGFEPFFPKGIFCVSQI